jgi:hypothetical protein
MSIDAPIVMSTEIGIHDLPLSHQVKSWMPTSVGMTIGGGVSKEGRNSCNRADRHGQ